MHVRAMAVFLTKQKNHKKTLFFKQMAVAHSIFTLDGGFQLFWAAFDLLMTVVPLKVALGWDKFDFWPFQKIIRQMNVKCHILSKIQPFVSTNSKN